MRATVQTFPKSPYDLAAVLRALGTGEAVVAVLSETGAPTPVAATRPRAPQSLMGSLDPTALTAAVTGSPLHARYARAIDRESAYKKLTAAPTPDTPPRHPAPDTPPPPQASAPVPEPGVVEQVGHRGVFTSLARSIGTQLGREITRSLLGTAKRSRRR
jgi:hypothetical protein